MDSMTCSSVSEEDYTILTISVLRHATRDRLSCMLSGDKVLESPGGYPRDWRGLCDLLEYSFPLGYKQSDPISKIFKFCDKTTIAKFIECLEIIDRYDVIEDTKTLITSDIEFFKKQKYCLSNVTPLIYNDTDSEIITDDDLYAKQNGLPPPRYKAFILFDDADREIALEIVNKIENEFKFKVLYRQRDLRPGVEFESDAIIKLISDRCDWLIVILSNNTFNCSSNRFILLYIRSLSIKRFERKIIPCVVSTPIPVEFELISKLYFNKIAVWDPWVKLKQSLEQNNFQTLINNKNTIGNNHKLSIAESIVHQSKSEFSEESKESTVNNSNSQALTGSVDESIYSEESTCETSSIPKSKKLSKSKKAIKAVLKYVVPKW